MQEEESVEFKIVDVGRKNVIRTLSPGRRVVQLSRGLGGKGQRREGRQVFERKVLLVP